MADYLQLITFKMKKLVICNLKQYSIKQDYKTYQKDVEQLSDKVELIIAPQAIDMHFFNNNKIKLAAQNVSKYEEGAYTGEISVKSLKNNNVKYCLVGHYERKEYNETTKDIIDKIILLTDNDIKPILSIGETKEEYDNNKTLSVIESQIANIYNNLPYDSIDKIIISYEPSWMIGNENNINKEEIEKTINTIKAIVNSYYEVNPKVIYGGGVDNKKIRLIKEINSLDGIIIGSKSTDSDSLKSIIEILTT